MLRLERVSKFYSSGGLVSTGFSKVDLKFELGEFVAITGESGSGKSTLLNVISGLDSFEEGEMFIMDQPTSGFSKEDLEEYRKKYIGNIFQTFHLINSYTVYQNVELVLLMSGYDKREIPERVREIIAKVGLSDYERTKASKLSGGQKQRVAIARALAKETPIIVADEPTGNLDSKSAAEIVELLHQLSKDKLIIIVTHNYEQVAPYVTRKITMHDGKVAEDKHIAVSSGNSSTGEKSVETAKADGLSFGSMSRLGVRNTFNIPAKFFLLLTVFLFLCMSVISQYTSFKNMADMDTGGYNYYFMDTDRNRILFTREDRKALTDEDYAKIREIDNVGRIIKNDLMLDLVADVSDDFENGDFYITSKVEEAKVMEAQLVEGRMPKSYNEAILIIPRDGYAEAVIDMVMKADKVDVRNQNTGSSILRKKMKIVGYGYLTKEQQEALDESDIFYEALYCVGEKTLDDIRMTVLEHQCSQEILFADNILSGDSGAGVLPLKSSDKVPQGEIYVPADIAALTTGYPIGENLKLINKSLYFESEIDFTVGAVYNQNNLKALLEIENFEEVSGSLFINPKDYNDLFDKGNFQSSVRVKDDKLTAETAAEIEKAGYRAFCVHDGYVSYAGGFGVILNTLYTVMLAAVLIVLFFITYFIIKLILKSRNIYFSTIRMLGATKENCSSLLKMELFAVFNIAYFICMGLLALVKMEVIEVAYLQQLAFFLTMGDLVILYAVLCLMSVLLAGRYARQLFKKTAMNAYKEEV